MPRRKVERPVFVAPSPQVLKSIRAEMKKRNLSALDRRMASVTASLVAEPARVPGFNEGIFYPPTDIPGGVLAASPARAARSRPTTGKLMCLVLLVDFSDNKGTRPVQEFRDMLFSRGTYPTGSLRDFYHENSYGKTDVDGQVVGWLRLPKPYSYYVNGDNGGGPYPTNAKKMVEEALSLSAAQVNFGGFDTDGDGYLDGLFVVHAGGGAEADPNATTRAKKIWSHQWNISAPFTSNGVTAYSYCTEPEDGRAGVFCHEFGHMLGLPDLYDTTYQSEGVGTWCVMGAGSWNNGGLTPGHFCAWSKMTLGWLKPKVAKKAASLTLKPVEQDRTQVHRLWSKGKAGKEYFLLENRQRVGFDSRLPGSGLIVWHIDETQHNNDHAANYWVGVRQADGQLDLEKNKNSGDAGDPFPGSVKKKILNDTSDPSSDDRFGNPTGVSVTNIAVVGGNVTCKIKV